MSVLGLSPLGTDLGPWGGPGLITVKGVIPISANEVVVICDRVPRALDDDAFDDALIESHYSILDIDPTVGDPPFIPKGEYKAKYRPTITRAARDDLDTTQIVLMTDVPLERHVRYSLTVDFLEGAEGETFAGPNTFEFEALTPVPRFARVAQLGVATDPYNDFANGFVTSDEDVPVPVGPKVSASGQIARHGGVASTRKRLHRRLLTERRRFLVLSTTYGTDWPIGQLARPGAVQRLVNDIAAGAKTEPDVIAAECVASVANNAVDITLRVRTVDHSVVEVQQVIQL